jgi:enoyl-CoA hydratase/carnithine racemase
LNWGLVSRVVPLSQLMPETMSIAKTMASYSPVAVKFTLEAIHRAAEAATAEGLTYETSLFGLCFSNDDTKARMAAFLNKKSRTK